MLTMEISDIRKRIRLERISRGWSLADFQIHSAGQISAVAMGSYERGERTLSIPKVMIICTTFRISLFNLIAPVSDLTLGESTGRHIYDLRALQSLAHSCEKSLLLSYIAQILRERGDWMGAVISLRSSDVENLSRIFAPGQEEGGSSFLTWLERQEIMLKKNLER